MDHQSLVHVCAAEYSASILVKTFYPDYEPRYFTVPTAYDFAREAPNLKEKKKISPWMLQHHVF